MKLKTISLFMLVLLANSVTFGQHNNTSNEFYTATKKWFDAWQLLSKTIYNIPVTKEVDFVFFDEKNVYATSALSAFGGKKLLGPSLVEKQLDWRVATHGDTLTLPDGKRVEVGIMSFTSVDSSGKPFFVMPLPSFWKAAGVDSKELGFDNLLTGIFLHEFSHSQQVQNFGKQIGEFEKRNLFDTEMNDNIVQMLFKNDAAYKAVFEAEQQSFYRVATSKDGLWKSEMSKLISGFRKRQQDFFTGKHAPLKAIEDVFLTMEGLGQHAMYAWLVHPQGGKMLKSNAITGVRRGGKWWSQEEGFALFLLLEKKLPPSKWGRLFFEDSLVPVVELLEQESHK